jgi:hypothetical protein
MCGNPFRSRSSSHRKRQHARALLDRSPASCDVAIPALYFGTLVVAAMLYPGYNHMAQFASELGSSSARYPIVFNAGTKWCQGQFTDRVVFA